MKKSTCRFFIGVCPHFQPHPAHGPFNGKDAVSELTLAFDVLRRLPPNSIVIGDRFYDCVRLALEAKEHGHEVNLPHQGESLQKVCFFNAERRM